MTAQGHPRTIFRRAIERGNVVLAELTVREIGRVSLDESLALTALIAVKEPRRRSRMAARWLLRLLEEQKTATIEEAALADSALAALGGPAHEDAYATLTAIAARAERQSR